MKNQSAIVMPLLLLCFLSAVIFFRNQDTHYQLHQLMKSGEIQSSQDFNDSIDFTFENNFIFLKLKIKEKPYTFLFDTGSPTCLSSSLIQQLDLKKKTTLSIKNENEVAKETAFFITDFKIQNTVFEGVIIKELPIQIATQAINGIIGANLMQHCLWQIDYAKQKIYFSNRLDLLSKPKHNYSVSFTRNIYRTPRIYLAINNFPKRPIALLSTGNPEAIMLNEYFSKIRMSMLFSSKELESKVIATNDTSWSGYAGTLAITDLRATHIKTTFLNREQCFLGNEFLKNYVLTIDWKNRKMYFGE